MSYAIAIRFINMSYMYGMYSSSSSCTNLAIYVKKCYIYVTYYYIIYALYFSTLSVDDSSTETAIKKKYRKRDITFQIFCYNKKIVGRKSINKNNLQ